MHPGRAKLGRVGVQVRAAGERESGVGPCDIHSVYGPGWSVGRVCVFCSRVKRIWLLSAASAAAEATCAPRGKWPWGQALGRGEAPAQKSKCRRAWWELGVLLQW